MSCVSSSPPIHQSSMRSALSFFFSSFFLILSSIFTLTSPLEAIPEDHYEEHYQAEVIPWLATHEQEFSFPSWDGLYSLCALRLLHTPEERGEAPAKVILFLEGATDSWYLEEELFYDLFKRGYDIYTYDHRGQGTSPHLSPSDSEINHIEHFKDYTKDFQKFLDLVKKENPGSPLFLLAHSMGGAIAADYLENTISSPFSAIVLMTPMFEINFSKHGLHISEETVLVDVSLNMVLNPSAANQYAYPQEDGDVDWTKWTQQMMHPRFAKMVELCKEKPDIVVGGPSNQWLEEAIRASQSIRDQAAKIEESVLIITAQNDTMVINKTTEEAASKIPKATCEMVEGASHTLLQFDEDSLRNQALDRIDSYFQHSIDLIDPQKARPQRASELHQAHACQRNAYE